MKILIPLLLLTACATEPAPIEFKSSYSKPRLEAQDAQLLKPCRPLTAILLVDNPTPAQVLEQHAKEVIYYNECADKQSKLSSFIRKIFDVQE